MQELWRNSMGGYTRHLMPELGWRIPGNEATDAGQRQLCRGGGPSDATRGFAVGHTSFQPGEQTSGKS